MNTKVILFPKLFNHGYVSEPHVWYMYIIVNDKLLIFRPLEFLKCEKPMWVTKNETASDEASPGCTKKESVSQFLFYELIVLVEAHSLHVHVHAH